jgi:hypothetical protein
MSNAKKGTRFSVSSSVTLMRCHTLLVYEKPCRNTTGTPAAWWIMALHLWSAAFKVFSDNLRSPECYELVAPYNVNFLGALAQ